MKKSIFTIRTRGNQSQEVKGYTSDYFGVHKMVAGGYSVTHLLTGLRIVSFAKMGQARKFIDLLESSDANWGVIDKDDLMEYLAIMADCVSKVG